MDMNPAGTASVRDRLARARLSLSRSFDNNCGLTTDIGMSLLRQSLRVLSQALVDVSKGL